MPSSHSKRALYIALIVAATSGVAAGAAAQDNFTVFVRGTAVGGEQIGVTRAADGWTITGTGRSGPPLDMSTRQLEMRYDGEWNPIQLTIDGTARGQPITIRTWVEGTTATTHIANGADVRDKTDTISADALILPNPFWAPFAAVAARVRDLPSGTTLHAYVPGQASFDLKVGESTTERIQTVAGLVVARRTSIALTAGNGSLDAEVWGDPNGRLLRLSIPGQNIDVIRQDIASVSSRRVTISRPNDEPVKFGSNGVTLVGTLSKPAQVTGRVPAVVLVGASGPHDRDEVLFGIPVLGEIADALANNGFMVLRYDKRGMGQSGGRPESTNLTDLSEDLRAAVKTLADRKDVDSKHIAVVGHSEGGAVALLAASKDKRIAAVALLAANGVSGSELVLAQQRRILDRSTLSPEEKQERINFQRQINEAIVTGRGLDQLPPDVRRQVDDPEFQSMLANDPAKVMPGAKQPVLIVQGALDTQVEPSNADRLEELAKKRKNGGPVDVVKVANVNHLLVPAVTGEANEYPSLKDKHVSTDVTQAIVEWLRKTLTTRS